MLDRDDLLAVRTAFGVDDAQVRRDHFISHLLSALATIAPTDVTFFGGTALARTHLVTGRLSEDIDMYTEARPRIAEVLDTRWPSGVRKEFPRTRWDPGLRDVRDVEPASIVGADGDMRVRVQLIASDATYARWPTEVRAIEPRYRDVSPFSLRVPTIESFVAMKVAAWRDRHAARDLFDLALMARNQLVTREAIALVEHVTGTRLLAVDLDALPANLHWTESLAHQTRLDLTAPDALALVRVACGVATRPG